LENHSDHVGTILLWDEKNKGCEAFLVIILILPIITT